MRFTLENSDYQDSDAMKKINNLSFQYSHANFMFQIDFLMEEFEFLVAEE